MFFAILRIELFKIFKRPRTFISFGAIAIIVLLVQLALKVNGKDFIELYTDSQSDTFYIPYDKMVNGYFVCVAVLHMILIHVPLLIALIAGDMISGEANLGTLRLLGSKPVTRTELILAKFSASSVYVILLLIWMAFLALFGSILLFGKGDLVVFKEMDWHQMNDYDVLWRFFAAFIFAALALTTIAAMAMMFSVFSENSLGPIVATVCVVIVFTIIQQLKVPMFEQTINPWSFTTHMLGWKGFFYVEKSADGTTIDGSIENPTALVRSAMILIGYIVLFLGVTIWYFRKKDILS
ncbi:MAG TPA: ABC transporter permease subunit [Chitinophagaceae bacterium]|jgi:ABC-2 type transport system permease protein|nr:MAG: ABC-2 family transporter protein [Ignavibacteria bacterium ADurb.Bin266]HMW67421.1 ABC transporter permease subunit [Chitinophagaceae bacterium]HMX78019.1 ABC transporter permease subunit [Chitinophagaceae bacterium]HNA91043.1 ABC transporter permease subunit [Chitinophagaceae bacterium]HNF46291.1 ABC transporter permease subunit [Chitinophagaceae bacterium]